MFLMRVPVVRVFWVSLVCAIAVVVPRQRVSAGQDWGQQGMVVSAAAIASETGLAMLRQGGNAIDAAVATTFVISVVEPQSAGIGGGGFLLLRLGKTGEIKTLDFRERAPIAATPTMYLDKTGKVRPKASTDGYLAVAVPGTVAGLAEVHRRYGTLPWKTVVNPALQLAERGFLVSPGLAAAIARQQTLQQNPAARQIFTRNGKPLAIGDRLIQTDLAQTLNAIVKDPNSFYTGSIGQAIAQDMQAQGGLISLQDLQQYQPIWRDPVCGQFRVYRVCSMPPPSSGGVHLLQMLNMLGDTDLKALGWHHPDMLHLLIEVMRLAYRDRAEYLGDPDFVQVPVAALTHPVYAAQRRREIDMQRARPSNQVKLMERATFEQFNRAKESNDTSHLSVVDRDGNAVSLTFTVNLGFGAGVVTPGTGIVLNNEMDDFVTAPGVPNAFGLVGRNANAIAPRKTPLSSMTPTIVTEGNQLRLVIGAPGGSTIITTVLQVILNSLVYDMEIKQAIAAARLHHQWVPDVVMVEANGFDSLTVAELQRRGHALRERPGWGNAMGISRSPTGLLQGAADPRGEGTAAGF
jgi:gamma-glutamyltranspeptidase/glutathione hydrolase